jgi:potassium/chloride transporter 4/5/6
LYVFIYSNIYFYILCIYIYRIQTEGLGGLRPNTIVLCWPLHWKKDFDSYTADAFVRKENFLFFIKIFKMNLSIGTIAIAEARRCAVIVPKNIDNFPDNKQIQEGTIDIWWIIHDGGLLFLIAFLLKRNKVWSRCRMRLFTVAQLEDNSVEMKKDLEQYMYQLRIEAEVDVVEMVGILF